MIKKIATLALGAAILACGNNHNNSLDESGIPDRLNFKISTKQALSIADGENLKNVFATQSKSLLEASFSLITASKQEDLTKEQKAFTETLRTKCSVSSNPHTPQSNTIGEIKVGDTTTGSMSSSLSGANCAVENKIEGQSLAKVTEVLDKASSYFRGEMKLKLKSSGSLKDVGSEKITSMSLETNLNGKTVNKEKVKAIYLKGTMSSKLSNTSTGLATMTGDFEHLRASVRGQNIVEAAFNGELKTVLKTYKIDVLLKNREVNAVYIDGNKMSVSQTGKMFLKFNQVASSLEN